MNQILPESCEILFPLTLRKMLFEVILNDVGIVSRNLKELDNKMHVSSKFLSAFTNCSRSSDHWGPLLPCWHCNLQQSCVTPPLSQNIVHYAVPFVDAGQLQLHQDNVQWIKSALACCLSTQKLPPLGRPSMKMHLYFVQVLEMPSTQLGTPCSYF